MTLPDLSNVRWRNYAAFGAIIGGTALACATGGVPAAIGLALAGIFGNVAASDAARKWDERRRDPKYAHPNHELTLLVGRAIARTYYDCADDARNKPHKAWFKALAKVAEPAYLRIAEHPSFDALVSVNLPGLFEAAARNNGHFRFDMIDWSSLIDWIRTAAEQPKNDDAAQIAAQWLTDSLFANVRETFKRDFEGDGRAYAALCIDVNGEILARLAEVAQNQQEALSEIKQLHEKLDELRLVHAGNLKPSEISSMAPLLRQIGQQTKILNRMESGIDRVNERARQIDLRLVRIEKLLRQAPAAPQGLVGVADLYLLIEQGSAEQQRLAEEALARLDERAESRHRTTQRKLALLVAGSAAIIAVILAGAWLVTSNQRSHTLQLEAQSDQLAGIQRRIEEHFADKRPGEDPTQADLPPELIEQAKLLKERGDQEQRALAEIALDNHAQADAIIQRLKEDPIADAHRILTLEGENWYQAGQFDKAIEPYEKALALRPNDFTTRNNAASARTLARLGDIAAHRHRAIEIAQRTLAIVRSESWEWAMTQNNLGNAWQNLPTGDRGENLRKAIRCYENALTIYTKEAHPVDWAMTQNNLGIAWQNLPTGDRGENLRKAIECYENALTIHIKAAHPVDWAKTQNNLGSAWQDLPTGDRGENLRKAIECYENALTIHTKEAHPVDWAMTQNNLGAAWRNLPTGDRGENLRNAIRCYENALTIHTKEAHPVDWAMTQNNLGNAWQDLPTGDRGENLRKAIRCYENALTIRTKEAHPVAWATTHYNTATAAAQLALEMPGERCDLLRRAIASGKAALTVRKPEAFPRDHAATAKNLEIDRSTYESAGCAAEVPFDEIRPAG